MGNGKISRPRCCMDKNEASGRHHCPAPVRTMSSRSEWQLRHMWWGQRACQDQAVSARAQENLGGVCFSFSSFLWISF
jgi:hypothetical protein